MKPIRAHRPIRRLAGLYTAIAVQNHQPFEQIALDMAFAQGLRFRRIEGAGLGTIAAMQGLAKGRGADARDHAHTADDPP